MQNILSFTQGKKKYVSKPFDFETMCIINDAHNDPDKKGPLNMCREAVEYMFEGTEATKDVIDALGLTEHTALCLQLWQMYVDTLAGKNVSAPEAETAEN